MWLFQSYQVGWNILNLDGDPYLLINLKRHYWLDDWFMKLIIVTAQIYFKRKKEKKNEKFEIIRIANHEDPVLAFFVHF